MIVVKTPLRVSFLGGGTDFPGFYNEHNGAVISTAIDKYIYTVLKPRFDDKIVLHYSKTEVVSKLDDIKHGLIREALRKTGVREGVEITTMADVPAEGTGLGSSSSLTVGVLHALYTYKEINVAAKQLAEEACDIEIEALGQGIGKQDQYIAAFGGMRIILFQKDRIDSVVFKRKIRRMLEERTLLFYTGVTRQASTILNLQNTNIPQNVNSLKKLLKMTLLGKKRIDDADPDGFGRLINDGWELKKELADGISNPTIEDIYMRAKAGGAIGCKVCGAGGGGFLLAFCEKDNHVYVRSSLSDYKELPIRFVPEGSKVILKEG